MGISTCKIWGSLFLRIVKITFSIPAGPAAACVCPMFDLAEPIHKGFRPASATEHTGQCLGLAQVVQLCPPSVGLEVIISLGIVSPMTLLPTWSTAIPRITAWTKSPSLSRFSTTTTQPSAQSVPSVSAAKAQHRPSADMARSRPNSTCMPGPRRRLTPPDTAISHSPRRRALHARCVVTSDNAHGPEVCK
ncbi:hypothetical protein VTH82DRAFT_3930 [Thermothelomyces myriococcoides]